MTCVMKRSIQASKLIRTKLRTNTSLTSGWTERKKVSMAARDRNSPVLKRGEEEKKERGGEEEWRRDGAEEKRISSRVEERKREGEEHRRGGEEDERQSGGVNERRRQGEEWKEKTE